MAKERSQRDAPGVIAPPPLIYLGFLIAGLALDFIWPVAVLPSSVQYLTGAALIAAGGIVAAYALREFRGAGTSFKTHEPATAMITGGPFRFSRNPIYIGLGLFYAGIGVASDNLWVVLLLAPCLAVVHYGVILREERYLEAKFGEQYLGFKASVRRWF